MRARVPAGLEGWLKLPPLSPDFFVPRRSLSSPLVPLSPNFFVPGGSQSSPLPPLSPNFFVPKGSPALLCLLCPRTSLSPNFSVPDLLCPQRLELSNASFFPEHLCPRTSLSPNFFVLEVLCPQRLSTPGLPRLSNLLFGLCDITLPRIYPAF